MRDFRLIRGALVFGALLFFAGCATMGKPQPYELAPVMTKLTMAAQIVLLFPEGGSPVPDDKLIEEAFKERPELLGPFSEYIIKLKHNRKDVVILVCSPDGKHGLIEDASWTPQVDHEWYETDPLHPAEFSLDPATGSGKPAP